MTPRLAGRAALITGSLAFLALAPLPAQHASRHAHAPAGAGTDARLDSLASAAARGTARYADRAAAVADGYRRIGPEFPGMGEHWLHPGSLLAGGLDAARPTLLVYSVIAGVPRLLGVGFVAVSSAGDPTPELPGWPWAWHEHSGLLGDESGARAGAANTGGTRVWVLHAWTGLTNPGGAYRPDNWALPYVRAGLAVASGPAAPDADAGRAASLLSGGDAYLRAALADMGLLAGWRADSVEAALARARRRARDVRDEAVGAPDARTTTDALRRVWADLARDLRSALGPDVQPLLEPPHASPHSTPEVRR